MVRIRNQIDIAITPRDIAELEKFKRISGSFFQLRLVYPREDIEPEENLPIREEDLAPKKKK
jgi:hypothetical protein